MQNKTIENWERKHEIEIRDDDLKISLMNYWNSAETQKKLAEALGPDDDPDMFKMTEVIIIN